MSAPGHGSPPVKIGDAVDVVHEASRRARDEMNSIERLLTEMRLASFRSYLSSVTTSMSVLVPSTLDHLGINLDTALQRLRPTRAWPYGAERSDRAFESRTRSASGRARPPVWPTGDPHIDIYLLPLRMGTATLSGAGLSDWVELVNSGRCLDVMVRGARFELTTAGSAARLKLAGRMPETMRSASEGRVLADIVDHPIFRGRPYRVRQATCCGKSTALEFEVGCMPVEMPWRR